MGDTTVVIAVILVSRLDEPDHSLNTVTVLTPSPTSKSRYSPSPSLSFYSYFRTLRPASKRLTYERQNPELLYCPSFTQPPFIMYHAVLAHTLAGA